MINKRQLKLHFSKNASTYDEHANVQKKMRDILINLISQNQKSSSEIKTILEIGCGTGYLTKALTKIFPSAHITAVDIAQGMIDEIKPKFKNNSIDFICGDIEEITLDVGYDIIISNATFQWFNDMPLTIEKLYSLLKPKGVLCFSTFGKDTFKELNQCFKIINEDMPLQRPITSGQSFYTLNELALLCKEALKNKLDIEKISIQNKETFEYEYFNNCSDFFYSIKKIGANNSNMDSRRASPVFLKKVINLYNEKFKEDTKIKVTYHCLFYKIIKI